MGKMLTTLCSFGRVTLSTTRSFYRKNVPSIIMRSFLHVGHGGLQNGGSCWAWGCSLGSLSGLSYHCGLLHSGMHFKQLHCGVNSHTANIALLLPQRTCLQHSWRFNSSDIPTETLLPHKVGRLSVVHWKKLLLPCLSLFPGWHLGAIGFDVEIK